MWQYNSVNKKKCKLMCTVEINVYVRKCINIYTADN